MNIGMNTLCLVGLLWILWLEKHAKKFGNPPNLSLDDCHIRWLEGRGMNLGKLLHFMCQKRACAAASPDINGNPLGHTKGTALMRQMHTNLEIVI